jgi:hypothetical protein
MRRLSHDGGKYFLQQSQMVEEVLHQWNQRREYHQLGYFQSLDLDRQAIWT